MPFFDWNNELNVGVDLFNEQHKKLIGIVNKLHDAMLKGEHGSGVTDTVRELAVFTRWHFDEEERHMELAGFSGLETHKREHAAFIRRVESFITRLDNGSVTISISVLRFIISWLTVHILKTDKKYCTALELSEVA